jgi:hypothetical protein
MRRALALLALCACSSKAKPPASPFLEPQTLLGAWELLALVPAGAERVIEVDFARIRANATVGPLVEAWGQRADLRAMGGLGFNPLLEADQLVMCSYSAVSGDANLVIARGARMKAQAIADARDDATRLDDTTVVFGPGPWRDRVAALSRGEGGSVVGEAGFVRLRDEAVPKGAPGASLRATARFAFGRRVQLAGELGIDEMPGTASVWGDVADDVAVIGLLSASSEASARRLADGITELYRRDLAALVRGAAFEAQPREAAVRVVFHLGPNALARLKEQAAAP